MFDLTKGILMLWIIYYHSRFTFITDRALEAADTFRAQASIIFSTFSAYGILPIFFMISGYTYRKKGMDKAVKGQLQSFWKPYVAVGIAVTVISVVKKVVIHESIKDALFFNGLPFLLGYSQIQSELFGIPIGVVGPIWFFLVFTTSTIVLNAVLQEKSTWKQIFCIALLAVGGLAFRETQLPFCLQQTAICTGYMYIGWFMKKNKFLEMDFPVSYMAGAAAVCLCLAAQNRRVFQLSVNEYGTGDLIATYILGAVCFVLFQKIDIFEGHISDFVRWIGRYSMYFLCFHSVAYTAIPWAKIINRLGITQTVLCISTTIMGHLVITVGGTYVLLFLQKKVFRKHM